MMSIFAMQVKLNLFPKMRLIFLFFYLDEINCNFSSKRLQRRYSKTKFSATLRRNNSSRKLINTTGKLTVKIGWTNNSDDESSANHKLIKMNDIKEDDELLSQATLQKWFDQKYLNPLDPDAQNLVQFISDNNHEIAKIIKKEENNSELFRFNEDELAFMTEEEFNSIERFHLLRARFNNDLSYKNRKLIPQTDRELELDRDRDTNIIDESLIADPIDLQRYRGKKYLKKVYEIITNHCENLNRDKMNTNILIGDEFPTFGSLSLAFLEMFGPKRPLKPVRRITSSRASCKINEISAFNVVVNVVRATNIPIRSEEQTSSSRKSSTFSGALGTSSKFTPFKHANVHPHVFVAISLKDHHHTCRTSSAEGSLKFKKFEIFLIHL
jgi:coiled-coil and C2 domain-containing protein 2A